MRLVLILVFVGLTANAAYAQSEDFNPYRAVVDAMSLGQAQPLIEAAYGSLEETTANLPEDFAGEGVRMFTHRGEVSSLFLFCNDRLAAVSAVVTPTMAANVLMPFLMPDGPKLAIYPGENGVFISVEEPGIQLSYSGVGTKTSYVALGYPADVFKNMSFRNRCKEMASN